MFSMSVLLNLFVVVAIAAYIVQNDKRKQEMSWRKNIIQHEQQKYDELFMQTMQEKESQNKFACWVLGEMKKAGYEYEGHLDAKPSNSPYWTAAEMASFKYQSVANILGVSFKTIDEFVEAADYFKANGAVAFKLKYGGNV